MDTCVEIKRAGGKLIPSLDHGVNKRVWPATDLGDIPAPRGGNRRRLPLTLPLLLPLLLVTSCPSHPVTQIPASDKSAEIEGDLPCRAVALANNNGAKTVRKRDRRVFSNQ